MLIFSFNPVCRVTLQNLGNKFGPFIESFYPLSFPPGEGRALKKCLAGNFSEGARLPRWTFPRGGRLGRG